MKNAKPEEFEKDEINPSETNQVDADSQAPVTVTVPDEAKEPLASQTTEVGNAPDTENVQVEPHLTDLLAGVAIPVEEEERAKQQKDLDQVIHQLLVIGLVISVSFMLVGLVLDLTMHRVIPTAIPQISEIFSRALALRPSGFLSLGLLVLMATPIVRVIGSFIAFIYERDWRYAGITFLVLIIVTLSVVLGKGG